MAVTVEASGTQTATLDTEHTLATEAEAKVYVLIVDTGAMVNGDITVLRVKFPVLSGGTSRLVFSATYAHVQADPIKTSIPFCNPGLDATGGTFTLEQTDGTGRAYPWALVSIG